MEEANHLKKQIVKVLDNAENKKRAEINRSLIQDDSVLGARSGFEEI